VANDLLGLCLNIGNSIVQKCDKDKSGGCTVGEIGTMLQEYFMMVGDLIDKDDDGLDL
jgi:hypothetical protein